MAGLDFPKNLWYNLFNKIKKERKSKMNTYYCVVKLDENDFTSDRQFDFVVSSSYQDAARKL